MRTIQMTLDDNLVKAVDRVSKELHTSRSAFTRKALQDALARYKVEQLILWFNRSLHGSAKAAPRKQHIMQKNKLRNRLSDAIHPSRAGRSV